MNGFSSAASNNGEKWLTHITAANRSQATTGNARKRRTREWRTGRIQRFRVAGDATRSISVTGADSAMSGAATSVSRTCWTMWIENRVVSYWSIPDSRAKAMASMPPAKATRSAAWHGVRRVQRIDPPDRPGPPREGDQDGQGRQRLERPAEEEVREGRRLGRGRAMGGGRRGGERGSHGRDDDADDGRQARA